MKDSSNVRFYILAISIFVILMASLYCDIKYRGDVWIPALLINAPLVFIELALLFVMKSQLKVDKTANHLVLTKVITETAFIFNIAFLVIYILSLCNKCLDIPLLNRNSEYIRKAVIFMFRGFIATNAIMITVWLGRWIKDKFVN